MSLISFAGVSRVNGELKFRTANNVGRITQLQKLGDTEVEMRFLGREMTKTEAAKELLTSDFANGRTEIESLLVSIVADENPFAKKTVKVKVKKTQVKPISIMVKHTKKTLTPAQERAAFMKKLMAS